MKDISRRSFLKTTAGVLGGLAIVGSVKSKEIDIERQKVKKEERYEAGHVLHLKSKFSEEQLAVLKNFPSLAESVLFQLRDYTKFHESLFGVVPGKGYARAYEASIKYGEGREIDIILAQHYVYENAGMPHFAEAILTYDHEVSEEDVNILRKAITSSGLEKSLD